MGIYKNPDTNLRACPRIVLEDEDGVGMDHCENSYRVS